MKVNDQSTAVKEMAVHWAVTKSLLGGTAAMRLNKSLLPKWPKEEEDSYKTRIAVATLFPALKRTVGVMVGKPFSSELSLGEDVPSSIVGYCDDINLEGQNLHTFSIQVFSECLSYGLCGVLVDFPITKVGPDKPGPRTIAEEKAIGARPYFTFIKHDQLLGWKIQRIKGVTSLSQLRIMECAEEPDGEFGTKEIPQVRVLEPGVWFTYRKHTDKDEWYMHDTGVTTIGVVPFVPFYGTRLGFMKGESPLQDLAYLNVKHWQSQSDQDTILHVARVPILAISGAESPSAEGVGGTVLTIGTSAATMLPLNAKMEYVEHTGAAIEAGQASLKDLEDQMIQTGAELLVVKPGQRSATESNNEAEANKSDLQRMVEGFEDSMDEALQIMALWLKEPQGGHIALFKDFSSFNLSDASAQMVLSMQQGGLLTKVTTINEMKRRGVLSPDIDADTELEQVDEEGPSLGEMVALGIDPRTGMPIVPVEGEPTE